MDKQSIEPWATKPEIALFVLLLSTVVVTALSYPQHLLAPGARSPVHAGIKECSACHLPFTQPRGETCVSSGCHDDIFWNKRAGIFKGHLLDKGCMGCHSEHVGAKGKVTFVAPHSFVKPYSSCTDCHAMNPGHAKTNEPECSTCHLMSNWKLAWYSHQGVDSSSPCTDCHELPGYHFKTRVKCINCHSFTKWKSEKFRHKREKKKICSECHSFNQDHHKTTKGCDSCHHTGKWGSIKIEHSFPIQHGAKYYNNKCVVCHPESLDKADCYSGCHHHSSPEVIKLHVDNGITEVLTSCNDCHKSGTEHSARSGDSGEKYRLRDLFMKMYE